MFRKIAIYSASLYGATLISSAVSFAVTMVIARRVPKEALGLYGFYVTLYSFAGMLLVGGVNQALSKFLADPREDRRQITRLALAGCAVVASICWPLAAGAWFIADTPAYSAALVVIPFFLLTAFGNSVFRSEFAKWKEVAIVCGISATNSILTVAFLYGTTRPDHAPIAGDLLSYVLPGAILAVVLVRRALGPAQAAPGADSAAKPDALRRLLVFAWPLTVASIAFVIYSNAASFLIRGFVGLAALGDYFFAIQLMHLIDKPLQILARVVLAGFSARPDAMPAEHRRFLAFNLAFFPPLAAAVVFLCPYLLITADWVLGSAGAGGEPLAIRYVHAPFYVALFALAVPARCVEFLVSSLAIARGRPQVNRDTHVFTALAALPILALLVITFGATGAAAMPLVYQTIFLTIQTRRFRADAPEIVAQNNRGAIAGTLLLALAMAPAVLGFGVLWMIPALAGYVLGGHVIGAWDVRLLVPKKKPGGRGAEPSPATP